LVSVGIGIVIVYVFAWSNVNDGFVIAPFPLVFAIVIYGLLAAIGTDIITQVFVLTSVIYAYSPSANTIISLSDKTEPLTNGVRTAGLYMNVVLIA